MEKKFKNKWSLDVKGTPSLIKAFTEEVKKLGYEVRFLRENPKQMTSYNDYQDSLGFFQQWEGSGKNGCRNSTYFKELHLPQDWDLALKLAAEVEEEVPEYVECIKVPKGWIGDDVYEGSIHKTESYEDGKYRLVFKDGSGQTTYRVEDHFKPSTKEAYEAQFQLKPEVGKWYTLKDSLENNVFYVTSVNGIGNCYGYGFHNGIWFSSLDDNGCNCACNEVAFKSRARLATNKEVETALLKYANQHYSIGTKYLTTNQNINKIVKGEFKIYSSKEIGCYITDGWGGAVLENGQWAEILPNEVKVNGYIVTKINDSSVKVGCKQFDIKWLDGLYNFIYYYGGEYIASDGSKWTGSDISKIIDAFNKM